LPWRTQPRGWRQRITESPTPAHACVDCRLLPTHSSGQRPRAGQDRSLGPLSPHWVADPSDGARSLRRRAWNLGVRGAERCRPRRLARGRGRGSEATSADARREPARARPRCARAPRRASADGGRRVVRPSLPAHATDRGRPGGPGRRSPPGILVVARRRRRAGRSRARSRRAAGAPANLAQA
jgi:hypothetical protein